MGIRLRRKISAWVLLSVFVPMIFMAAVHRHDLGGDHANACYSCLHHIPHPGHLSGADASCHQCVLCQFNSLPYVLLILNSFSFLLHAHNCKFFAVTVDFSLRNAEIIYLRAPPCILL